MYTPMPGWHVFIYLANICYPLLCSIHNVFKIKKKPTQECSRGRYVSYLPFWFGKRTGQVNVYRDIFRWQCVACQAGLTTSRVASLCVCEFRICAFSQHRVKNIGRKIAFVLQVLPLPPLFLNCTT